MTSQLNSSGVLENLSYLHKIEKALLKSKPAIWQPDPRNKPQCLAYEMADKVDEMGYGGQAGGGKTDLMLGLAATKFKKSLLFRHEYAQMEGIILRGDQLYPSSFVAGDKRRWQFDGRIITLGSLKEKRYWKKYQGRSNGLIAFDEAPEIPEEPVRNVTGWTRSPDGSHTLVLFCFNPPTTPEGEWIIERFAPWLKPDHPNPAQPGEIRWFAYISDDGTQRQVEVEDGTTFEHDGEKIYPISRTFIRASLDDNPHLTEAYKRRIDGLPEPLRTMVKYGDMTVRVEDDDWQVIPTQWVLEAQKRWEQMVKPDLAMAAMGVDVAYGGKDNTVISQLYGTWFAPLIVYAGSQTPDGITTKVKVLEHHDGKAPIFIDMVGYGASAYDHLKVVPNLRVVPINGGNGSKAKDKSRTYEFTNLRAEMYWLLREALNPESGVNIALPPSRDLRVELCAATYKVVGSKIQIEAKQSIKDRLNRSPDLADAVVMAWHGRLGGNVRKEMVWL